MIGIVVLNYKNYHVTIKCVDSILNNPPDDDYSIYIIDNGSQNESVNELSERYSKYLQVKLLSLPVNIGFARACNYGLLKCREDQVNECIMSNSDITFPQGTINRLVEDVRTLDNAIIVGPKIYNPIDKIIQHSSRLTPPSALEPLELHRIHNYFKPSNDLDEENGKGIRKVYSVSGCCFALDVTKFTEIGDFDENTFLYNEENILGCKTKKKGYSTYIDLGVLVEHNHGASSGRRNDFTSIELIKSTLYYWRAYRNRKKVTLLMYLLIYSTKAWCVSLRNKDLNPTLIFNEGYKYWRQL